MKHSKIGSQAIREMMQQCDKKQVIEILISTLENEARLRNELDSLTQHNTTIGSKTR